MSAVKAAVNYSHYNFISTLQNALTDKKTNRLIRQKGAIENFMKHVSFNPKQAHPGLYSIDRQPFL